MPNVIEREIKIRILSPPLRLLRESLRAVAVYIGAEEQLDYYFDNEHRQLTSSDRALRLRISNARTELTYKGPKENSLVKSRLEATTAVSDAKAIVTILESIGYRPILKVRKFRENYSYEGATVSLDEVEGLGEFLEIEQNDINEEELLTLTNKLITVLNIKGAREKRSYAELMASMASDGLSFE
ncbi:CYTH domain-containing protein [Sulfodiicoccus acidiphilus]|uniref:CYTH domain-containing protein n=1 Tax=Sulfodiicoccus acidiphilus TaxID=1670455 RepID=A0A348B0J5_9CREN|nr:class IV adenylate cyclase [Sulfodiicoccus acidiphilus]BBD71697.1 CYTH domain-containing protein [Sulfodiicoccus acidiphilus]GGT86531.1 CYTH domain-containing protein [Sulfodiicoccus acidiphilus]